MQHTLGEALLDEQRNHHTIERVEYEPGDTSVGFALSDRTSMGVTAERLATQGLTVEQIAETVKPGDSITIWGKGFGYPFRGVAVGNQLLFYMTEAEQAEQHRIDVLLKEAEDVRKYVEGGRANLMERKSKLPAVFQQRIEGFMQRNPSFGWKHGMYEMFCCEQAVVFAETLETAEAVRKFSELDYEDQRKKVPALSEGHSGNTMGVAISLAYWYLRNPSRVPENHGAMCALVGCKEYGCWAASEEARASE